MGLPGPNFAAMLHQVSDAGLSENDMLDVLTHLQFRCECCGGELPREQLVKLRRDGLISAKLLQHYMRGVTPNFHRGRLIAQLWCVVQGLPWDGITGQSLALAPRTAWHPPRRAERKPRDLSPKMAEMPAAPAIAWPTDRTRRHVCLDD